MRKAIAVVLLLSATACASATKAYHRASDDLGKATRLFNDYTRWGYTDKAAEFVAGTERAAYVEWRNDVEKTVRITDVHVGTLDFPKQASEATVLVTWTFYRNAELTEHSLTAAERWYQKDFHWYVRFDPKVLPSAK